MSRTCIPVVSLLALTALGSCASEPQTFARATPIEDLSQAIGGPKALAAEGDFMLENDQVRVVITGARNSMGPSLYGGSLIDADLQWGDPARQHGNGNDQLAEMFPTVNLNVARPLDESDVFIVNDGADGNPAVIRVVSAYEPFITLLGALWGIVGAPDFHMVTDYVVEPGKPWVTIKTSAVFGETSLEDLPAPDDGESVDYGVDTLPALDWAIESGVVIGDFYLQGGSIDVFAPGDGFDEDGLVFEAFEAGQNTFQEPFSFPYLAGTGDGISYGIAPAEGNIFVPLFTASQTVAFGGGKEGDGTDDRFPAGTALTYERYFFIGHGDVGSIFDGYAEARDVPTGKLSGTVAEQGTGLGLSGMHVFLFEPGGENPVLQWETDVDPRDETADGSFAGKVPVGDWELLAHRHGRPDGERLSISVAEGEDVAVRLESPRPGLFTYTVRDQTDQTVPAKVTIFRADQGAPSRDPDLGDGFEALTAGYGRPEMVLFPMYGYGEVELPDGDYIAVASRGLEYEIHVSEPFVIDSSRTHHTDFQVIHAIDSDGWISADLHVHAQPSHDSGVRLHDRVRTMVSEGVEFFVSTDHDYITDYGPVVEDLQMEEFVKTAVGVETTTIEIGHFLSFPQQSNFLGHAGGAYDWTDQTPDDIVEQLYEMGEDAGYDPIVFVGHPRDGILGYFDQYGLNPYGGQPGVDDEPGVAKFSPGLTSATNPLLNGDNFTFDVDALELLNGKRLAWFRTPTQPEMDAFKADPDSQPIYEWMTRTMEEQDELENGIYKLGYGFEGEIDDWFTLLNLGFRHTALGNSDTHGWTSTESGCPRSYILSDTDTPALIDDQAIADAVRNHKVVASYGPFVRFWANEGEIGDQISTEGGAVEFTIEVQAPTWIGVDRVEFYENGTLVEEFPVDPAVDSMRFLETFEREVAEDAWFTVIVTGESDLAPLFSPVEIPYVPLEEVVTEALGGVSAVSNLLTAAEPFPRVYPIHPYALTNPIWVDVDGDGWDAPGVPGWLEEPEEPAAR
ncbi:MAG: CehA/McbA family metallohydrolase [Proteobacteria bacterium]|nr:CehA/McbA family metallohydrolase [Pseudomonadota bacterium]